MRHVARSGRIAANWYLLVWEPLWLVAGLALLVATSGFQRATQPTPEPTRRQ